MSTKTDPEIVPVEALDDGDEFTLDGITWYTAAVNMTLSGTIAVYVDDRRDDEAPTVRVAVEPGQMARKGRLPDDLMTQSEARAEAKRLHAGGIPAIAHAVPVASWGGHEKGWTVTIGGQPTR
jgi:hypothetical protein